MIIKTISFTKTLQVNTYTWEKVGFVGELAEKDVPETELQTLKDFVDNYFKESLSQEMRGTTVRVVDEGQVGLSKKEQDVTDKLFVKVKEKLSKFNNKEDAQAYLDTTEFKMTIEAKQLVNILPLKNK